MARYLLTVPLADDALPEVVLPPQGDAQRVYYLQLHLLLQRWQDFGCAPFSEMHLREQFPDAHVLTGVLEALLGANCRTWHAGVNVQADAGELIMPNQMAMILLKQLTKVLPTEEEQEDAEEAEKIAKRACEAYDCLMARTKRLKITPA